MHPARRQRLFIVLLIVLGTGTAVGLAGFALRDNINLFYPPYQVEAGQAPVGQRIRVGGLVLPGSVARDRDTLIVRFAVTDGRAQVPVLYEGILPDLFAEDDGVVVTGVLGEDGVFVASQVLAKHDENYMPRELEAMFREAHPDKEGY